MKSNEKPVGSASPLLDSRKQEATGKSPPVEEKERKDGGPHEPVLGIRPMNAAAFFGLRRGNERQSSRSLQWHGIFCLTCLFLLLFAWSSKSRADTGWLVLEKGLETRVVEPKGEKGNPPLVVHLVRISPQYFDFRVLLASDLGQRSSTAQMLAESRGAVGAINLGFFDPDLHPLGLVIAGGKTRIPLNRRFHLLREGIFLVRDGRPMIERRSNADLRGVQEAIQSGPLLVLGGRLAPEIASTSKSRDARSAIGIDRNRNVLLVVSSGGSEAFTLEELARFLLPGPRTPWGCQEALNLDGGNSTQLYLKSKEGTIDVPGLSQIPVALGIFRRSVPESLR